jgi:molecular chaperone GrpE
MHDRQRRRMRPGGPLPLDGERLGQRPATGPRATPDSPFNPDAAQSAGPPPGLEDLVGAGRGARDAAAAIQAEIDRLNGEVATAQAQTAEHLATLQRTAAEFANYRRRTLEEREREAGLASEYLLRKVITIADDFDRAIEAMPPELADNQWMQGIAAIDRKLRGLLESEGVKPIESVGRPFDPREHEAITSVPATGRPDGEVVAEVQRGYRLRDRVLRPSLVAVAAGGESPPSTTHSDDESTQDLND